MCPHRSDSPSQHSAAPPASDRDELARQLADRTAELAAVKQQLEREVARREQLEQERLIGQDQLQSIIDNAPAVVFVKDLEGRYQMINREFERFMNLPREDIIGKRDDELFPLSVAKRLRASDLHIIRTGESLKLDESVPGSDEPQAYITSKFPLLDANRDVYAVCGIATNIDGRKRAEEALRESESKFRKLANVTAAAMFIHRDSKVLYANPAAQRITGYTINELFKLDFWQLLPERFRDRFRRLHLAQLAGARLQGRNEVVIVTRDGKERWVELTAATIDFDGQPAVLGAAFDVTDRRQATENLRAEQRLLEQLLQAHERDRKLTAFEIHDGMIQYLAGALMYFEAYRDHRTGLPEQAQREFQQGLDLLRQTIGEGRRLISGLRPPIIDEQGLVPSIQYLIGEDDSNLEIELRHDERFERYEPLVEGTVYRIVQEALTNVRRHSGSQQARITLQRRGNRLHVEIRDWGCGFDPQQDAENGIGLQGIRERAKLLRGQATIESARGQGTRLHVALPVKTATAVQDDTLHPAQRR